MSDSLSKQQHSGTMSVVIAARACLRILPLLAITPDEVPQGQIPYTFHRWLISTLSADLLDIFRFECGALLTHPGRKDRVAKAKHRLTQHLSFQHRDLKTIIYDAGAQLEIANALLGEDHISSLESTEHATRFALDAASACGILDQAKSALQINSQLVHSGATPAHIARTALWQNEAPPTLITDAWI